jgi:hypothetical protein
MVGIAQKIAALADKSLVSPIDSAARFSVTAGAIHLKNLHPAIRTSLVGWRGFLRPRACRARDACKTD